MKRPLTNVEIMADNMRKAELFTQLVKRIEINQITVHPTDADGGEMDRVVSESDLIDLIRGQGQYQDLFL